MSDLKGRSTNDMSYPSHFVITENMSDIKVFVGEFKNRVLHTLRSSNDPYYAPFRSFAEKKLTVPEDIWLHDNHDRFFKETANEHVVQDHFLMECGFIYCMLYSPDGEYIIVGHSSGLLQMRHGSTGAVLCTLRNIQFPPKPVYALEYSRTEPNVCYAACLDGNIYRIEIPQIDTSVTDPPEFCIRADPLLDTLNMQFFANPGTSSYTTPFIKQRYPALSLGILESGKMAVGYADTSIKVYDMETQEAELTYKVHKLRLQFIPKKLQRMHFGQVVALRAHQQNPNMFASGAWDKTLRIWDVRCAVGCVMTFEGVDICADSIDLNVNALGDEATVMFGSPQSLMYLMLEPELLHYKLMLSREHCIAGSWMATDGLAEWDLTARKMLNFIRVQNRRQDVDGEYVYACRYWRSKSYNRKGKYAIIGGSGTNCLEVINLHNRYITCSYPASGAILAVTSHQERIAFGGTSSSFNIVSFYDPKYQKEQYLVGVEPYYDPTEQRVITLYHDADSMYSSVDMTETDGTPTAPETEGEEELEEELNQNESKSKTAN